MAMASTAQPTAAQLAERRRALGITQAVLAELIRSKRVTLSFYETRAKKIPVERAKQLDAALTALEAGFKVARLAAGKAERP